MPVTNIPSALRSGLGRPDAKFPAVPPAATSAQLLQQLTNNWGLVGTMISRAEAAWILELAAHPNADQALLDSIASRCAGVRIGSSADELGFDDWLATLRGAASPTPTPATPVGSGALTGRLLAQDGTKVATTASHEISFASNQGGQWLPDLQLRRRDVADPEPKDTIAQPTAAELSAATNAAAFKALLDKLVTDNKSYLLPERQAFLDKLPEGERSNYAYLNLTGRRIEQFFNEVQRIVGRTSLSSADAKEARKAINLAYRDQFRGRTFDFDRANTGTYWSYGHDAAFVHVFEKMLEALPENDAKRKPLQAQIDFILTNKYAPNGHIDENDAEGTMELVAVDKGSRRVVSMTPDSDGKNAVRYETLKAGDRSAYRDGTQYFWEGARTQLTDAEVATLRRTAVDVGDIVFRRKAPTEQLRQAFRYDWDGNRMLNAARVDTGWWGHCDIKALIETILADMAKSKGVTEFRSDTKRTVEFSRDMQLEALAAMLNFDDAYTSGYGQARSFGQTNFAGGRNDDRPTSLSITTDRGQQLQLGIRLQQLSDKADPTKMLDVERAFNPKLADDKNESFTTNNDVQIDARTADTALLNATGRKIIGTTDGYSFDASGRPIEFKSSFEFDPNAATGDKVLLGTELTSIEGRTLDRYYYDPATKSLSVVPTTFEQENGTYVAKEGVARPVGKIRDLSLGKELRAGDDVQGKLAMLEEAVRTGRKIATDSDTGMQVWNGEVHAVRRTVEWRSPDGKWEREGVTIDATFGSGKVGTFLHKLDDEGRIVESMEIRAAVDFYWADNPRIAPLINERGNWWVNRSMSERGILDMGAGKAASLAAVQDLADLIYLGVAAKNDAKVFTIVHEGKRYVYENEAAWRTDVDKLSGAGGGTGGGTGGTANQIVATRTSNLSVPDNDPNGVSDTLNVDRDGAIKSVKVDIDLRHTYVGDLDVILIAPDGAQVKLHARGGRDADDLVGTYGDALRSHEDLAALVGKQAKGDWKLKIVDLAGQDVGNLVSWGLKIDV